MNEENVKEAEIASRLAYYRATERYYNSQSQKQNYSWIWMLIAGMIIVYLIGLNSCNRLQQQQSQYQTPIQESYPYEPETVYTPKEPSKAQKTAKPSKPKGYWTKLGCYETETYQPGKPYNPRCQ